ncbi:MAG: hypothetical protein WD294_05160 [Phycisphaeraceae bacterium]
MMRLKATGWFVCLAWVLSVFVTPVQAGPLVDRIPDDAVVYLGWQGTEEMAGFDDSHFAGFLEAVEVDQLLSEMTVMLEMSPEDAEAFADGLDVAESLFHRPWALYVGLPSGEVAGPPTPAGGLVVELDAASHALAEQLLADMEEPLRDVPPGMVNIHLDEQQLIIGLGNLSPAAAARLGLPTEGDVEPAPELRHAAAYTNSMDRLTIDPAAAIYVDVAALLSFAESAPLDAMMGTGAEAAKLGEVLEVSGLNGLHRVVWAGAIEQQQWRSETFIEAPAPRAGLLSVLNTQPLDDRVFASVPRTAQWFSANRFNFAELIPTGLDIAALYAGDQSDPREQFNEVIAMGEAMLGVNIRQDLLNGLGDQWLVYGDMSTPSPIGRGFLVMNFGIDADRLPTTIDKLAAVGAQQLAAMEIPFQLQQREMAGGKVHYLNTPLVNPGLMTHEDRLLIAMTTQTLRTRLQNEEFDVAPITAHPAYTELMERLDAPGPSSVAYADLPRTMVDLLDELNMGLAMLAQEEPMAGRVLANLPRAGDLAPHLTPMARVGWSDDAGYHNRSIQPFPFSDAFAPNGMIGPLTVGGGSMGVAILLPAVGNAREEAKEVSSAQNMRGIYIACFAYAADNDGRMPAQLGILHGYARPKEFLNPRLGDGPPVPQRPAEELADWVSENSDYVYLAADAKVDDLAPDEIVLYERLDPELADGINIGFGDGRVQYLPFDEAVPLLDEAGEPIPDHLQHFRR